MTLAPARHLGRARCDPLLNTPRCVSGMGPQGTPTSTPPHCTPIFEHDLGSERGIMRWGLRDDGCPWCCSRWRSAPSPAAPPPARFPATRAGDFSHARAGIDQKIVALRARSESRLKSNAGNDQHIDDEMFGATVAQGRLRAAWCRQSRHARLRLSKTCNGVAPAAQQNSAPTFIAAGRPDVVRELLAMKRHRLNAC
jgi:hypothetical protein